MQIVDNRTWIIRAIIFNYQIDPPDFRRINYLWSRKKKKEKKRGGNEIRNDDDSWDNYGARWLKRN